MKHLTSLGVVLGTALLTALLAAPVLGPAVLRAEGEAQDEVVEAFDLLTAFAPASALPAECAGLVVDLKLDREVYTVGQKCVLTITASNKKGEARKEKVTLRMHSQEPESFESRSMPMPTEVLAKELSIDLKGEASESMTIETGLAVEAGKLVTITLQIGDEFYPAGSFGVLASAAPPAEAPTQVEKVAGE